MSYCLISTPLENAWADSRAEEIDNLMAFGDESLNTDSIDNPSIDDARLENEEGGRGDRVLLVSGTIKGLATDQLEEIGCQIILGNTYHLALRPTSELIDEMGGLHKFMNWPRALLTDSGGFQMVSLLHLADITEEGVTFQVIFSFDITVDGKPMLLTPEESIQVQNRIGADIIMALDDVVRTTITGPRIEEAMYPFGNSSYKTEGKQNLFGIVQGGLDPVLRDICVRGLVERNLLWVAKSKDSFWRVVAQCTAALPEEKPRYVMCFLGADMYDCVYPTRTARFGTALIPELKHKAMAEDTRPIDPTCACMVCKNYTRGLHSLPSYKRCYGISASVISQPVLHAKGGYVVVQDKLPNYVVPDLADFKDCYGSLFPSGLASSHVSFEKSIKFEERNIKKRKPMEYDDSQLFGLARNITHTTRSVNNTTDN
ncbi:hypothetical protein J5N97_000502 [Dioscorea zingiberensis]|uniref:tRNA-guanine(15) transglycosylase-like domain-containing protein n=1 Tax=Dioscorea zingiberensis TaxID=325984 RepID=A0A9D5H1E6_9LILI|nr:hypothetical protein J5N97_000502 [Dioscorea zingiberensis]